ncbi:MAG: DNA translocase FtsK 4TM domain-containing protein [Acidobacteriota bacterium]
MARPREEIVRELAGFILALAGLLVLIAVLSYHPLDPSLFSAGSDEVRNLLAHFGAAVAGVLVSLLGLPALVVPALLIAVGWQWLWGLRVETPGIQGASWAAAVVGGSGLLEAFAGRSTYRGGELAWGGELGRLVAAGLISSTGRLGGLLICAALLLVGVVLGVRGSLARLFSGAGEWLARKQSELAAARARRRDEWQRKRQYDRLVKRHRDRHPALPDPPLVLCEVTGAGLFRIRRVHQVAQVPSQPEEAVPPSTPAEAARPRKPPPPRFEAVPVQKAFDFVRDTELSELPEKTMLLSATAVGPLDPQHLAAMRELVETKCHEFRVEGRVEDVLPGPVITTYEFRPAAGVKYSHVVALEDDLALGLQVEAARIERIPGKATVGIEVPNPDRQTIVLREIVESSKFVNTASPLTLALGKDIHGRPFVADLARMPHLLIGGFTGSGKSVGINAMIMSVLFKAAPEQVRFIMIDPKRVELGIYEKLPHLLTPIISDPREAARALRWAVREMRERYALLASCKVRNLAQYNARVANPEARAAAWQGREGENELKPLPFIVVIIDELADLMMTCPNEVEDSIGHLSQMARAVGIHLIFATQRPSVDIITGVIKANFPCRIAFKVRTRIDSRTILDCDGAECLLGMGDMLFLPPGTSRPMRLHGCFVREEEILTVLKHFRKLGKPEFDPHVMEEPEPGAGVNGEMDLDDPMYEQAARLIVSSRKASASYMQRKLKLGYSRSARLLDMMEQEGLVGPAQGSRGREVLVPPDYFGEVDATRGEEDGDA